MAISKREALEREAKHRRRLDKEYLSEGEGNRYVAPCVRMGSGVKLGVYTVIGGFSTGERRGTFGVVIEDDVHIGHLTAVMRGTVRDTLIRSRAVISQQCNVGHDCIVGHGTYLRNNVVLAGGVEVGDNCDLSIGVRVRPGVTIGNDVFAAMGAVIVKDVPPDSFVMGFPARVVDRERPILSPKGVT